MEQLSSLGIGEAIIIGNLVRLPAFVKISKFTGKLGGSDPDIKGEWSTFLNPNRIGEEFG